MKSRPLLFMRIFQSPWVHSYLVAPGVVQFVRRRTALMQDFPDMRQVSFLALRQCCRNTEISRTTAADIKIANLWVGLPQWSVTLDQIGQFIRLS